MVYNFSKEENYNDIALFISECPITCKVDITTFFKREDNENIWLASLCMYNTDVSTTSKIKSSTLCYKDGPQLPPMNFTTACKNRGVTPSFMYNERLDRVSYIAEYELDSVFTELYDVVV